MHCKYYEFEKAKTTYILQQREYIILITFVGQVVNSFVLAG